MPRPLPTSLVAALSLVAGFAVAEATGVRALGGVVLVAGAAWCALRWRAIAGVPAAAALVGLYVTAFVASHVLAGALGAWGAVAFVAGVVGTAAWVAADRRPAPRAA